MSPILQPVVLLLISASVVLSLFETALYLAIVGTRYRLGPIVLRQTWHAQVKADEADSATLAALKSCKHLAFRRQTISSGVCYSIRKSWGKFSTWPYVTLTIRDSADGAILEYECRPYLTMVLFLPLILLFPTARDAGSRLLVLMAAAVVALYLWGFLWEIPRMAALHGVRGQLRAIGVRICPRCGYDLRASSERCPECGEIATPGET